MILYLTEQGAEIGLKNQRLEIRKGSEVLESVRLLDLEQIVLFGSIHLTTKAMHALLAKQIDVCLLSQSGRFLGRLAGAKSKNIILRHLQFQRLSLPEVSLDLVKRFLTGKLSNQRALLMRYQRKLRRPEIAKSLVGIRLLLERLTTTDDIDVLRGLEGKAAAFYFGCFGELFSAPGIHFTQRLRRPPPDPVNILLSFGYTLLGNLLSGLVEVAGLDPYLGALHLPDYGRPSLALDLLEEWRTVIVDTTVLRVLNTQTIRASDFLPLPSAEEDDPYSLSYEPEDPFSGDERSSLPAEPSERHLVLAPDAVKKWFSAYERRLQEETFYAPQVRHLTFRQILQEQVFLFARALKQEAEYRPFLFSLT